MRTVFASAFAYFLGAFAAGFALGIIRTLALAPVIGSVLAVAVETPFILTLSWFVCAWCIKRFRVAPAWSVRLAMGAFALALLLGAETLLALVLGRGLNDQIAAYQKPDALLGLAAQCLFAAFPLIQAHRSS